MDGDPSGRADQLTSIPPDRPRWWLARRIGVGLAVVVAVVYLLAEWRHAPQERAAFFDRAAFGDAPLVVAHQGGELLRPSNTMEAFEHAVSLGADVLDTDLHRSADGALVLIHDETVDRTSDGSGAVRDLTLAELRQFDFGYRFTAPAGDGFPWRGQGLGIVTVDELFDRFGSTVRYGIEIKQAGPEAATELCAVIQANDLERFVLVSSFSQPNMDVFRQACPEVATSATEREVLRFYVLSFVRLSGLQRPAYDALQVPEFSGGRLVLSEGFLSAAAEWGLPVVPWTIDDRATMERLLESGVAGINTNRPDLLIEVVG